MSFRRNEAIEKIKFFEKINKMRNPGLIKGGKKKENINFQIRNDIVDITTDLININIKEL